MKRAGKKRLRMSNGPSYEGTSARMQVGQGIPLVLEGSDPGGQAW